MASYQDPSWIFHDWEGAGSDVTDPETVDRRLVAAARERPLTDPDPEAAAFGRFVRALRQKEGWSRVELARRASLDPVAIPLLENGALSSAELSEAVVARLALAFGIPRDKLAIDPTRPVPQPEPGPALPWGRALIEKLRTLVRVDPLDAADNDRRIPLWQGATPAPPIRAPAVMGTTGSADVDEGTATPDLSEELDYALLEHPQAASPAEIALPDGRRAIVKATFAPPAIDDGTPDSADAGAPGRADLSLEVVEPAGDPVPGLSLVAAWPDETYPAEAPTDRFGKTVVHDLPLVRGAQAPVWRVAPGETDLEREIDRYRAALQNRSALGRPRFLEHQARLLDRLADLQADTATLTELVDVVRELLALPPERLPDRTLYELILERALDDLNPNDRDLVRH